VFLREHRRLRAMLLAGLLALPLLLGGWLWFRDSSLVSVRHVQISGVHGPESAAIDSALTVAARHMTTLDVRPAALRSAVARFPVVRDVSASGAFPHGLHIRVLEQLPVAALSVNGQRTAVAADGVVLGPALLTGPLPALAANVQPAAGHRVTDWTLVAALTVLGAAPRPLLALSERVYFSSKGLTVAMRNGLLAYFGDATRPHAKWLALATVLVAPGAAGATYVDVRLPERATAGFSGSSAPEARTAAESGSAANPATAAALAAGLASPGTGGAPTGASANHLEAPIGAPSATAPAPTQATATPPTEATSSAAPVATPATPPQAPAETPAPGG
jgi:cell division protein FtsQ